MNEPTIDREYYLIRLCEGELWLARFTRFDDGSALLIQHDTAVMYSTIYENAPDAWRIGWKRLQRFHYQPVNEAIRNRLLSKDEADSLITSRCQRD